MNGLPPERTAIDREYLKSMNTPTGTEAQVCADIAERQRKGIAKYGVTVSDNPLSLLQWMEHGYQEGLDDVVYRKMAIELMKRLSELWGQRDMTELQDGRVVLKLETARAITSILSGSYPPPMSLMDDLSTPPPSDSASAEKCEVCGLPYSKHPRCPQCGYTACDALVHGDHHLCGEKTPDKPSELQQFADEVYFEGSEPKETSLTPSPDVASIDSIYDHPSTAKSFVVDYARQLRAEGNALREQLTTAVLKNNELSRATEAQSQELEHKDRMARQLRMESLDFRQQLSEARAEVEHLNTHVSVYERQIREHCEFGSLFQPDGRFHKEANLTLGTPAVTEGGKWLVAQYDTLRARIAALEADKERLLSVVESALPTIDDAEQDARTAAKETGNIRWLKVAESFELLSEKARAAIDAARKEQS